MKRLILTKKCNFVPGEAPDSKSIPGRAGLVVTVTDKRAEKMVAGNVAKLLPVEEKPKKAVPKPKPKKTEKKETEK